jgi:hypothetical protein
MKACKPCQMLNDNAINEYCRLIDKCLPRATSKRIFQSYLFYAATAHPSNVHGKITKVDMSRVERHKDLRQCTLAVEARHHSCGRRSASLAASNMWATNGVHVSTVHHNFVPVMTYYGVHTTCGCSGAVERGYNGRVCNILTCSWCVANFGSVNAKAQPPVGRCYPLPVQPYRTTATALTRARVAATRSV